MNVVREIDNVGEKLDNVPIKSNNDRALTVIRMKYRAYSSILSAIEFVIYYIYAFFSPTMKWYNSQKAQLPENGQEVFIIVDGINYTALFNEAEKTFTVKNLNSVSFKAETNLVFWAEMQTEQASTQ